MEGLSNEQYDMSCEAFERAAEYLLKALENNEVRLQPGKTPYGIETGSIKIQNELEGNRNGRLAKTPRTRVYLSILRLIENNASLMVNHIPAIRDRYERIYVLTRRADLSDCFTKWKTTLSGGFEEFLMDWASRPIEERHRLASCFGDRTDEYASHLAALKKLDEFLGFARIAEENLMKGVAPTGEKRYSMVNPTVYGTGVMHELYTFAQEASRFKEKSKE